MFQASAMPAHSRVSTITSRRFCGSSTRISRMQARSNPISTSEMTPRRGIRAIIASVVDADGRGTPLAEQAVRPEDHHQQKEDEEEHLAEGRRHIIAAERLHDPDADAA